MVSPYLMRRCRKLQEYMAEKRVTSFAGYFRVKAAEAFGRGDRLLEKARQAQPAPRPCGTEEPDA